MNLVHVCLCIFVHCQLVISSSIDYSLFLALPPLQRHNDPPSTKSPSQRTIQKMIRGCDGAASDYFGSPVAMSGTGHLVVGAPYHDDKGSSSGSVYLYKHNGNHWVFMQSLTASDGAADDRFGSAVAMSGTGHLVVGSYSGAIYLFTLNSTSNTWGDEQKIVASDGAADDFFGRAVAMSGTGHLVVGKSSDDYGTNAGAVYLYTLNSTSNTWGDEQKIVSSDGAASDYFGRAVAMSGTGHLVVGAPYDGDKGPYSGSVYLYTLNSTSNTWGNEQKIVASDGAASDYFGSAVAMSGTGHLVVGAPYHDDKGTNAGAVYLYTLNSTSNTWGNEQKIVASDGAAYDFFGSAFAMSGTGHLVVGKSSDGDKGTNAGAVYLYTLNNTSNIWGDEQKIVASDGAAYDRFGSAVAMSGTGHLVVGTPSDDDKGTNAGAVYAIGEGLAFNAEGGDTSESETSCTMTSPSQAPTARPITLDPTKASNVMIPCGMIQQGSSFSCIFQLLSGALFVLSR
eukprot:scaffold1409_cov149-Alexandrium_tamarense.AAC.4